MGKLSSSRWFKIYYFGINEEIESKSELGYIYCIFDLLKKNRFRARKRRKDSQMAQIKCLRHRQGE